MSDNEKMVFDGRPVKAVHITVTAEFVSYVFADYPDDVIVWEHEGVPDTRTPLRQIIASEITDALEYRSHHLADSEDGDGLIAPRGNVTVMAIKVVDVPTLDTDDVNRVVDGMSGEI